ELEAHARPLALERFGPQIDHDDGATFRAALRIGQERAETIGSLLDQMAFLFVPEEHFLIAEESWARLAATERATEVLDAVIEHVEQCPWTAEGVDLRPALDALAVKPRKALPAVYAAVEGRHAGLPLFDSIVLLGRDRALRRLRAARSRLG